MSLFECPHCKKEHDINDYPDHLTDMRGNNFEFECSCGATFECGVDWEPDVFAIERTLKLPQKEPTS